MKVFEACMYVIKRRYATFIIYFAVFLVLSILIPTMSEEQFSTDFSAMMPNMTVINRDGDSRLSEGLLTFLQAHGNEITLEDDRATLQDATFFHATDFIVFLPQGFHDSFMAGREVKLEKVVTTDSAKGFYADRLVNQYLNLARIYLASGAQWDEDALVSTVLGDLSLEADATMLRYGDSAPIAQSYLIFNRMLPYILLVLNILFVTNITMVFKRPDLRMRNMCSPLKPRSLSVQQMLCCSIMSVLAWLVMSVVGLIMHSGSLAGVDAGIIALVLLNSFVFTVVALSLAAFLSNFTRSPNAQNAVANVVGLGLCFVGGVFVPLEMLGEGLLAFARFLPTYWNVTTLEHIGALTSFDSGSLVPIWQALLIQLVFAAAFFCLTLVVSKQQNQSEKSFGTIRTELEA
jgi:ABC-2 type transport system permease protein